MIIRHTMTAPVGGLTRTWYCRTCDWNFSHRMADHKGHWDLDLIGRRRERWRQKMIRERQALIEHLAKMTFTTSSTNTITFGCVSNVD